MSSNKGEALAVFTFLVFGLSGLLIGTGFYNNIPDLLPLKSSDVRYTFGKIHILTDDSLESKGISINGSNNFAIHSPLFHSPIGIGDPDAINTSPNNKTLKIVMFDKDITRANHTGWYFNNSSNHNLYDNISLRNRILPKIYKSDMSGQEVQSTAIIWNAVAQDPESDDIEYRFLLNRRDPAQASWYSQENATFNATITFNNAISVKDGFPNGNTFGQELSVLIIVSSCIMIIICIRRMLWKG
jgi:hypothetical protein